MLAVDLSTGIAAVLLGAAGIILIVMIVEAVGAVLAHRPKNKAVKTRCKDCAQAPCGELPQSGQAVDGEPAGQPSENDTKPIEPPHGQAATEEPSDAEKHTEPLSETKLIAPPESPRRNKPAPDADGERRVYDKSFSARLILSDNGVKSSYSALKNELLKSGFQSRICWRYESFRADKPLAAKLAIRSGGLCLFCALDPESHPQAEDFSGKKTYKRTPLFCLAEGKDGERISKELICGLAQKFKPGTAEYEECDYAALLPFEEMQSLIEKGLVRVKIYRKKPRAKKRKTDLENGRKIPVKKELKTDAENVTKTDIKTVVKTAPEAGGKPRKKRVKKGAKKIVNLEVVYACFNEGETATFNEIIKRVFNGDKNITYIKILGRGKADKNITVTADAFSRSAEKNILDAGGKIIRKNP